MLHIVGIGHSHLMGFTHGARDLLATKAAMFSYKAICLADKSYSPAFITEGGQQRPNPVWVEALRAEAGYGDLHILLSLPGAEWWRWSMTLGPRPYDVVDPNHDDGMPLVGQVVPYDLFKAKARAAFQYVETIIDVVRDITSAPITLFPPPPPVRALPEMFARFAAGDFGNLHVGPGQSIFVQRLLPTVEQYGIAPASFRLKVWRVSMGVVQTICQEKGVAFIAPDPEALDPDGFLGPHLVSDLVHANVGWGRLHLDRLVTLHATTPKAM